MFPHLSENQKANSFEISTPPDVPPPTRCTVSSSASCRQVPTCRDHLHERNRLRALPEWPCDGRLGRRENRVGVVCEHLRASCFESRAHAAEAGSASGNGGTLGIKAVFLGLTPSCRQSGYWQDFQRRQTLRGLSVPPAVGQALRLPGIARDSSPSNIARCDQVHERIQARASRLWMLECQYAAVASSLNEDFCGSGLRYLEC